MSELATDYLSALILHDQGGLETHLRVARQLGATAVRKGIGTLELAKIHEDVAEQITGTEHLMAQSVKTISSLANALAIDCES